MRGGQAKLEQHLARARPSAGCSDHGALQVAHRRRRVAEGLGAAGGARRARSRPVALAGLADEQVGGHRHGVGVAVRKHPRGLLVRARALHRRHVVLDRGAQDRVREAQVRRPRHEARALELRERLGGLVLRHVGHASPRRGATRRARPAPRARARPARRPLGRRSSRSSTDARTVSGPSEATRSALSAVGSMPSARTSLTSCSSRNGFPPVGVVAGGRERRVRRPEQRLDPPRGAVRRQRAGPDRDGRGVGKDLGERDGERAHLGRAHGQAGAPSAGRRSAG